jgi:Ribbon-helix-helix protein, copG family
MVYGIMQRTNIYLSEIQLESLRRLSEQRGEPVSELVRRALDEWLRSQGVRVFDEDEWERRFQALMGRRRDAASSGDFSPNAVEEDVARAVREVRRRRPARRR